MALVTGGVGRSTASVLWLGYVLQKGLEEEGQALGGWEEAWTLLEYCEKKAGRWREVCAD